MPYTNEGEIENYLLVDIDNSFSTQISTWISAVEAYINKYCNRPSGFLATSGTKYYDIISNSNEIFIDSFTAITSVQLLDVDSSTVLQTLVENTDFWTYPYNSSPKYKIVIMPTSSVALYKDELFPGGKRRLKVVGDFGYGSTVPKDIQLAATMLVAKIIEKGMKGGNSIQSESLGDYSVTYADVDETASMIGVKKLLDNYKLFIL